jgi:hypothetical protein
MATPVTRRAQRVTVTGDIPRLLAEAIRIATGASDGAGAAGSALELCRA